MRIHDIPGDPGNDQTRKRLGRGEASGQGKTSGKGHKGQKARSGGAKGGGFEGGQMPLLRRIPKWGFENTQFRKIRAEVTTGQLNRFEDGAEITPESLHAAGMIPKKAERIKVIVKGDLETKLTVKAHGFSKGAQAQIEAKGGTTEVIQ